jgi:hypothetical protein
MSQIHFLSILLPSYHNFLLSYFITSTFLIHAQELVQGLDQQGKKEWKIVFPACQS